MDSHTCWPMIFQNTYMELELVTFTFVSQNALTSVYTFTSMSYNL